jgi:DtxR family transcriptional regulator, manganese transport regulator
MEKSTPAKKREGTFRPAGRNLAQDSASNQQHTRRAHAQERAEDYVEAIADLIGTSGEARAVDLARLFGVSHVTIVRTIGRLQREGLVTTQPYRSIFLTPAGEKLARQSRERHKTVVQFLRALGVPAEIAHRDAEGIEHHVSRETLAAMTAFAKKVSVRQADAGK